MYTMKMKNWFHHEHIFDLHQAAAYLDRMVHNSTFWTVLVVMAMIAFLLLLMVFAVISSSGNTTMNPFYFDGRFPYQLP